MALFGFWCWRRCQPVRTVSVPGAAGAASPPLPTDGNPKRELSCGTYCSNLAATGKLKDHKTNLTKIISRSFCCCPHQARGRLSRSNPQTAPIRS